MDKRTVVIKPSAPHPAGVSVADVVDAIVSQVGMATLIGKHLLIKKGVPPHEIESLLRKHGL